MNNDILNNSSFNFKCPNCSTNISVKVKSVGSIITCPYCNKSIELQDDGFSKGINEANQILDKFGQDLKNMFK